MLIYTSLFPQDVRETIGMVGPETRGVEKMLRRIGFEYARQIDPFDGGPHFIARTDDITLVRDARPVELAARAEEAPSHWGVVAVEASGPAAAGKHGRPRFRAVGAQVTGQPASAGVPLGLAEADLALLEARPGGRAWAVVP